MKATLQKNSALSSPLAACASPLVACASPLAACLWIALLCVPAVAAPPAYRGGPRSRIEIGVYSGPIYARDYRYSYPAPYYRAPAYSYAVPYYPPPPVYVAPPVYAAPPVYQGLPPSSANYRLLAPSGSHLVAHVQEKLRGYGYYRGPVDGLTGAGTRSAVRSYQVDRGIEVTGRIDEALLSDLGL